MWLYAPRGPCDVLRDSSQFELISLPTKMLCYELISAVLSSTQKFELLRSFYLCMHNKISFKKLHREKS